jgi:hypothetical protein
VVFFIRNHVFRQTADGPNLTSTTSSNEAMVWLGHVAQPSDTTINTWDYKSPAPANGAGWFNPAEGAVSGGTNPNNVFASQWILGREIMLLVPTPTESYFPGPASGYTNLTPSPLSLFEPAMSVPAPPGTVSIPVHGSRYDLAATSISEFRQFLTTRGTTPTSTGYYWWEELSGVQPSPKMPPTAPPNPRTLPITPAWVSGDRRYFANPVIRTPGAAVAANWMSAAAAQTYPIFVRGCTQFIVEFAGDYLDQSVSPPVAGQDRQIDFVIDPVTGARHIRWYGAPRDVNGDRVIDSPIPAAPSNTWPVHDVAPVSASTNVPQLFERAIPGATTFAGTTPYTSQVYQCAWGPDTDAVGIPRPKMIRITIAIDDPAGHLNTDQIFEYVYELP